MKSILFLLAFGLFGSMAFLVDVAPGDPIPGLDVTLFNAAGEVVGTDVTDESGVYSFADVPNGQFSLRYGIREKGIKCGTAPTVIEGLACCGTINTATNRAKQEGATIKKIFGDATATVIIEGTTIRGSINVSSSNIKQ